MMLLESGEVPFSHYIYNEKLLSNPQSNKVILWNIKKSTSPIFCNPQLYTFLYSILKWETIN